MRRLWRWTETLKKNITEVHHHHGWRWCFFFFSSKTQKHTNTQTTEAHSLLQNAAYSWVLLKNLFSLIMQKRFWKQSHKGTAGLLKHSLLFWTARQTRSDRLDAVADILYLHIPGRMKTRDLKTRPIQFSRTTGKGKIPPMKSKIKK